MFFLIYSLTLLSPFQTQYGSLFFKLIGLVFNEMFKSKDVFTFKNIFIHNWLDDTAFTTHYGNTGGEVFKRGIQN